jgi:hypothetical protein
MTWWQRVLGLAGVCAVVWFVKHVMLHTPETPTADGVWKMEMLSLGMIGGAFVLAEIRVLLDGAKRKGEKFEWRDGLMLLACFAVSLLIYVVFRGVVGS